MSAEALGAVASKEEAIHNKKKKISILFVLAVVWCILYFQLCMLDVSYTIPASNTLGRRLLICLVPLVTSVQQLSLFLDQLHAY